MALGQNAAGALRRGGVFRFVYVTPLESKIHLRQGVYHVLERTVLAAFSHQNCLPGTDLSEERVSD